MSAESALPLGVCVQIAAYHDTSAKGVEQTHRKNARIISTQQGLEKDGLQVLYEVLTSDRFLEESSKECSPTSCFSYSLTDIRTTAMAAEWHSLQVHLRNS